MVGNSGLQNLPVVDTNKKNILQETQEKENCAGFYNSPVAIL